MFSPLRKWIIENKFFIKHGDQRPITHLLLNGGKMCIPEEYNKEFLEMYVKEIKSGYPQYICEVKTPVFRFFIDLDFIEDHEIQSKTSIIYFKQIQTVMRSFYPHHDHTFFVCTTTPKRVNTDYIKTGIHILFKNIYINKTNAMHIRNYLVHNFKKKFGERLSFNTWEDVIDKSVYNANGLRMIGSRKMSVCKECKGKSGTVENCGECGGLGKIDERRVYNIESVIDALGNLNEEALEHYNEDYLDLIFNTSIINYENPETQITYPLDLSKISIQKTKRNKKVIIPNNEEKSVLDKIDKKHITNENVVYSSLNTYVKRNLPDVYKKISFIDIYQCSDDRYIIRTDSKYCLNINREHSSNHIYLELSSQGLFQKCFCCCDTISGRISGNKCSNFKYKLNVSPISSILLKKLFTKYENNIYTSVSPILVKNKSKEYETFLSNLKISIMS